MRTEHRPEAYATLTSLRGRGGCVAHFPGRIGPQIGNVQITELCEVRASSEDNKLVRMRQSLGLPTFSKSFSQRRWS
jgi:hypothetical protein